MKSCHRIRWIILNILSQIKDNINKVMIGQDRVINLLLASIAAGGHVLLEDLPGTGKTVLAKSLARSMDLSFSRIQFTPDLLPSDVTGLNYFDQKEQRFVFREGPVFANLLLADEINRATPRTQSALLECMGEGQATTDGETRNMKKPFFVIATQNPVETLGCYPLPEAQLDRFLMKSTMEPLSQAEEKALIDRFIEEEPLHSLTPVTNADQILALQEECRRVFVHEDLRSYITALMQATRSVSHGHTAEGISPRGTLALLRASQAYALTEGRAYVVPEDIREVSVPVLAHRLVSGDHTYEARRDRIKRLLGTTPVPTEDWSRP
ncbi:MAG: AAA family ATPase [Blautia sp.]|nr:AAA family ATPase [Blautia sp.]